MIPWSARTSNYLKISFSFSNPLLTTIPEDRLILGQIDSCVPFQYKKHPFVLLWLWYARNQARQNLSTNCFRDIRSQRKRFFKNFVHVARSKLSLRPVSGSCHWWNGQLVLGSNRRHWGRDHSAPKPCLKEWSLGRLQPSNDSWNNYVVKEMFSSIFS